MILTKIEEQLYTTDNQFGFKSKLGTDMCIFTLKTIIDFYNSKGSQVYVCFLDSSKAFDRINHWSLFKKLINRNINSFILKMLFYWYSHQRFCVRWCSSLSPFFNACNGVRQGGICSPYFFNVYMDKLSVLLNSSNI